MASSEDVLRGFRPGLVSLDNRPPLTIGPPDAEDSHTAFVEYSGGRADDACEDFELALRTFIKDCGAQGGGVFVGGADPSAFIAGVDFADDSEPDEIDDEAVRRGGRPESPPPADDDNVFGYVRVDAEAKTGGDDTDSEWWGVPDGWWGGGDMARWDADQAAARWADEDTGDREAEIEGGGAAIFGYVDVATRGGGGRRPKTLYLRGIAGRGDSHAGRGDSYSGGHGGDSGRRRPKTLYLRGISVRGDSHAGRGDSYSGGYGGGYDDPLNPCGCA